MMVLSQKSRLDTPPEERCGGSRQWRREDCFFFDIGHDSTAASAPAVKTSPWIPPRAPSQAKVEGRRTVIYPNPDC